MKDRRQLAFDRGYPFRPLQFRLGYRNHRAGRTRVGMGGVRVDVVTGADLNQAAQIHHPDPVRQVPDHGQVVGDHEVGDAMGQLQASHQVGI